MDSDTFITQEKARELVALLERARELLTSNDPCDEGQGTWSAERSSWLEDVNKII